jgi:hypothetical protein
VVAPQQRQLAAAQRHQVLAHRQHVGERLARMVEAGLEVDHRHRRVLGVAAQQQFLAVVFPGAGARRGADAERVDVARQRARGVLDVLFGGPSMTACSCGSSS